MLALEVVPIPVGDVDAALGFYRDQWGFELDVDYRPTGSFRVVQLTAPGSACSVHLVPAATGARLRGLILVTDDLAVERNRLIEAGVAVSEIRHKHPVDTWSGEWRPGIDPSRRDYASIAEVTDPDGNTWTLQERGHRPS